MIREYQPLDVIPLHVPRGLYCTLIHPHLELNTSDSRSVLRRNVTLQDATTQSGNIAGLVAGLFQEDMALISRSLNDVIAEPSRSILIPGYDEVKEELFLQGHWDVVFQVRDLQYLCCHLLRKLPGK